MAQDKCGRQYLSARGDGAEQQHQQQHDMCRTSWSRAVHAAHARTLLLLLCGAHRPQRCQCRLHRLCSIVEAVLAQQLSTQGALLRVGSELLGQRARGRVLLLHPREQRRKLGAPLLSCCCCSILGLCWLLITQVSRHWQHWRLMLVAHCRCHRCCG